MQEINWKKLELCLSAERLEVYGLRAEGHRIAITRYLWNIAVCESLYAPLNMLEVGLRNAINRSMVGMAGSESWYEIVTLTHWGKGQIEKANAKIAKSNKAILPGRVIAELHFGFWTSMFESHYESSEAGFLPKGIKATFPNMPKSLHHRKRIKADLDKLRVLRNRIFHHERIIHWRDLHEQHELILFFLDWLDPDLKQLAEFVDRFPLVHSDGIQPFLDKLDEFPSDYKST